MKDGLLDDLKKALSERILDAELDEHLAEERGAGASNRRNGSSKKSVLTGTSKVTLAIPRDRAGWHTTHVLAVPDNITLMPLPSHALELNPVENIWQFMRDNWLSNRLFESHNDIVDHCCGAWSRLVDRPRTIISVGLRDWAHGC